MFEISSDLEFYCYLKASLPAGYEILALPSSSYYSEWAFCYMLYHKGRLLEEFAGDFRDLAEGSLVDQAKRILEDVDSRQAAA